MEAIQRSGGAMAYPSQIVYLSGSRAPGAPGEKAAAGIAEFELTRQNQG